jgi:iron complex outermembrane receptor protein
MNPKITLLFRATALTAASAGLAAAAPAPVAPKDDPVVLMPFSVSTNKDFGYLANDTLAGSRLRTNLADVPNAISVFTPEFMADLNAFGEADLMRYSSAAVPERTDQTPAAQGISIDTGGFQFRIRGQQASRSRNYFGSSIVPDTYNAERFEEARGPNAILFGLGGAGGILNTSTKTARPQRTFTNVGLTTDNVGLLRATLDHNQRLGARAAVRVNVLQHDTNGWQEDSSAEARRIHLAGTWRPWDKVTIRAEVEYGHVKNSLTRYYAPFDNVSLWRTSGSPLVNGLAAANAALGIGKRAATTRLTFVGNDDTVRNFSQTVFSQPAENRVNSVVLPGDWAAFESRAPFPQTASFSGPGGTSEYKQKLFGAVLEAAPFKNFFVEFAAVNDLRDHDVYDTTHDVYRILGEPGNTFRDGAANPYAGLYYTDSRWVLRRARDSGERFRLTASYQLDLGNFGRHNLSGLASRDNSGNPRYVAFLVADGSPFNAQPQNAANQLWTRRYITNPADSSQFAVPDFRRVPRTFSAVVNPGTPARTFTTAWAYNERNDQWGQGDTRLLALQSYFLNDRIVTTAGWRYTRVISYARPTNSPNTQVAARPDSFGELRFLGAAPPDRPYDFERRSLGVVAKATKWLSAYYNFSENAQPPGTTQTLIPDSSPFPLNSGEGRDAGLMVSLFGGRAFLRAGWFSTESVDQAAAFGVNNVSDRNDRIMDAQIAAGLISAANVVRFTGGGFDLVDLATDGYEFSFTGNVSPAWRVVINISKTESVQTNMLKRSRAAAALVVPLWQNPAAQTLPTTAGVSVAQEIANYQDWLAATTAVENTGTVGHREFEARAFTRYDFNAGKLKGAFIGGGLSYGSAPVIGRSTAGTLFKANIRREADALMGYRTRLPRWLGRAGVELQLNATNLLQQKDYTLVRRNPDGQLFRAAVNPPTNYALSARFSF